MIYIDEEKIPKREGRCVVPNEFEKMLQKRFDTEIASGSRLMEYEATLYIEWLQCFIYRLYMYVSALEADNKK